MDLSEADKAHLLESLRIIERHIAEAEPRVQALKANLESARSHLFDLKAAVRAIAVMSNTTPAPSSTAKTH